MKGVIMKGSFTRVVGVGGRRISLHVSVGPDLYVAGKCFIPIDSLCRHYQTNQ